MMIVYSNASFCDEKVTQFFNPSICFEDYSIATMNGSRKVKGMLVSEIEVRGVCEKQWLKKKNLQKNF